MPCELCRATGVGWAADSRRQEQLRQLKINRLRPSPVMTTWPSGRTQIGRCQNCSCSSCLTNWCWRWPLTACCIWHCDVLVSDHRSPSFFSVNASLWLAAAAVALQWLLSVCVRFLLPHAYYSYMSVLCTAIRRRAMWSPAAFYCGFPATRDIKQR